MANEVRKPFIEEVARQAYPGNVVFVTKPHSRWRRRTVISRLSANLILLKPWMPIPYRILYMFGGHILRPLVRQLMANQLGQTLSELRFGRERPSVAIFGHPLLEVFCGLVDETLTVYDCNDNYARMGKQLSRLDPLVRREETRFTQRCDLVLASAKTLYDRLRTVSARIHYMPNACEFAHFDAALTNPSDTRSDLNVPRPIIGFMGNLHRWIDFDIIRSVVQEFVHASIVFLGEINPKEVENDVDWLKAQPNVHFLGWRPWREVPFIVRQFDVALIPLKNNALTDAVSPDKLFQYLALGLPVVATPTQELAQFHDVIYLSDSSAFCKDISRAIAEPRELRTMRIDYVREHHTWQIRVADMLSKIRDCEGMARYLPKNVRT